VLHNNIFILVYVYAQNMKEQKVPKFNACPP